jgi:ADP-heptose:LPS heptosyltransferase
VVVLRALGLGDFLTAVPAYRALRSAFPDHEIVLAATAVLASLATLTGAIDRLVPTGELEPIGWTGHAPQIAVDLHGNGPASHRIVTALGAGRTLMFASEQAPGTYGPWWHPGEHEILRWCRLLDWYGIAADPYDLRLPPPAMSGVPAGAVVLHPGAASAGRRWPAERFAAVARTLHRDGHRVVLTGTPAEDALRTAIAARAGLPPEAVLRTGLVELASVVASAELVISNDTGTSHMATAYGTPSVTLFGPLSPALWGPLPGLSRHIALWHWNGERPGDPHAHGTDPRLLRISVEEVLEAGRTLLTRSRGALPSG